MEDDVVVVDDDDDLDLELELEVRRCAFRQIVNNSRVTRRIRRRYLFIRWESIVDHSRIIVVQKAVDHVVSQDGVIRNGDSVWSFDLSGSTSSSSSSRPFHSSSSSSTLEDFSLCCSESPFEL